MFKSYTKDTDGKGMDRKARKFARRSTYEYNRGVSKSLREARRKARLEAANAETKEAA